MCYHCYQEQANVKFYFMTEMETQWYKLFLFITRFRSLGKRYKFTHTHTFKDKIVGVRYHIFVWKVVKERSVVMQNINTKDN